MDKVIHEGQLMLPSAYAKVVGRTRAGIGYLINQGKLNTKEVGGVRFVEVDLKTTKELIDSPSKNVKSNKKEE